MRTHLSVTFILKLSFLLCYKMKHRKHRSLLRLMRTVCGVNLVLKSVHWHSGLLCRYSRTSIFWHAHDLYSNPQSVTTIPTVVVDGSHFGSLWYSFTIPKQFDIYDNHVSVRVLMVSCVTALLCGLHEQVCNTYSNAALCFHFSKV